MPNPLPLSDRALQPNEPDLLGRGAFVRNLATILCNAPKGDSVVFALYGKWGEGKTSTLTLLEAEFAARSANNEAVPVVIRFNPWVFSGRERLFAAFFEDIGNAIGSSGVPGAAEKAKKWKRLGAYSNLLGQGLNHVDTVLNVFGASVPGWKLLGKFLGSVGEVADQAAAAEDSAPDQNLNKIRGELEFALTEMPQPLLVVLDDLDRLPPVELVEIFQLLKSSVDLPNVHYLLLCDRGNIERNLKKQGLRPDYLEKIVQFSAPLPAIPDSVLHELLITQLQSIFKELAENDTRIEEDLWTKIRSSALPESFATLRDVKRFVGEFRMTLPVFCNGGYFELNPEHFIKLQALRLFCPSVIEMIRGRRALFMKQARGHLHLGDEDGQIAKDKTTFTDEELPAFLEKQKALRFLPLVRELLLFHGVDNSEKELATEKRYFASRLWFDSYFTLEMPTKYVSVADVGEIRRRLEGTQESLTEFIDQVVRSSGEVALVRCLENQFRDDIVVHGQALICAILSATPSDDTTDIGSDGPWFPFQHYFDRWLRLTPVEERKEKVLDLLTSSRNHLFFSTQLYSLHQVNVQSAELLRNLSPFTDALGKATAAIIEEKSAIKENLLQDNYWYAQDVWAKWGSKAKLRDWIRKQTESDIGLRNYLLALGGYRTAHGNDRDEYEYFWINHHRLETFPSLASGEKRCRQLVCSATSKDRMLYESAAEAFHDQAEYRKGSRTLLRKFPELRQLRFRSVQSEVGTPTAFFLVRTRDQGIPAPVDHPSLETRIEDYFEHQGPYMVPATLTCDGGQSELSAVALSAKPDVAEEVGRALDLPYVLMIFDDGRVLVIGLNGEGRLALGLAKDLIYKPGNR